MNREEQIKVLQDVLEAPGTIDEKIRKLEEAGFPNASNLVQTSLAGDVVEEEQ